MKNLFSSLYRLSSLLVVRDSFTDSTVLWFIITYETIGQSVIIIMRPLFSSLLDSSLVAGLFLHFFLSLIMPAVQASLCMRRERPAGERVESLLSFISLLVFYFYIIFHFYISIFILYLLS